MKCSVAPVARTRSAQLQDGELQFGNYFPNDWKDLHGARKQDDSVYRNITGELKILVIRWASDALTGLRTLRDLDTTQGVLAGEVARLEQGETTPPGWQYLWNLGPAEIYRRTARLITPIVSAAGRKATWASCKKTWSLPLSATSEISWRWCVDQLPSTLREDSVPSHDYLSIAVEFDNGRDITYYWSSTLPVGTGYDCPLPNWAGKEFHVVVRCGAEGLGQWQQERRNLYADYRQYMGEPPARIVKVWLIANSLFQRGEGGCDYADIVISNDAETRQVL